MTWKTVVLLLFLAVSASAIDLSGNLGGADYLISVPPDWNGTLIVYAHGYGEGLYLPLASSLLPQGYALAASSFRNGGYGWSIREGVEDTAALVKLFRREVGLPNRIILWGASMGGLITVADIEKHPGLYDGGVSACGTIAGSPEWWDKTLAFAVAYDVTFGWPMEWGDIGDVRDDLNFWDPSVVGLVTGQLMDPGNYGKWEFVRLVSSMSEEGFYAMSPYGFPWMFLRMWQTTSIRAEGEVRAGGPVAQNWDQEYTLTSEEKTYLTGLGLAPDSLLVQMNLRRSIAAHRPARNKMKQWYEPKGNINREVLTLHTVDDPGTPASHVSFYREQVESMGRSDLLVEVYTDAVGHCAFSPAQLLKALLAMDQWLETGERPQESDFPESMGFVHGFVPPDWPY